MATSYDKEDIGLLDNSIEGLFGISAQYEKLGIIAPELKANFSMSQVCFPSEVTQRRSGSRWSAANA